MSMFSCLITISPMIRNLCLILMRTTGAGELRRRGVVVKVFKGGDMMARMGFRSFVLLVVCLDREF